MFFFKKKKKNQVLNIKETKKEKNLGRSRWNKFIEIGKLKIDFLISNFKLNEKNRFP